MRCRRCPSRDPTCPHTPITTHASSRTQCPKALAVARRSTMLSTAGDRMKTSTPKHAPLDTNETETETGQPTDGTPRSSGWQRFGTRNGCSPRLRIAVAFDERCRAIRPLGRQSDAQDAARLPFKLPIGTARARFPPDQSQHKHTLPCRRFNRKYELVVPTFGRCERQTHRTNPSQHVACFCLPSGRLALFRRSRRQDSPAGARGSQHRPTTFLGAGRRWGRRPPGAPDAPQPPSSNLLPLIIGLKKKSLVTAVDIEKLRKHTFSFFKDFDVCFA